MIIRIQTSNVQMARQARTLAKRDAEIAALRRGLTAFWNDAALLGETMRARDIQARILVIETEAFTASMGG